MSDPYSQYAALAQGQQWWGTATPPTPETFAEFLQDRIRELHAQAERLDAILAALPKEVGSQTASSVKKAFGF